MDTLKKIRNFIYCVKCKYIRIKRWIVNTNYTKKLRNFWISKLYTIVLIIKILIIKRIKIIYIYITNY